MISFDSCVLVRCLAVSMILFIHIIELACLELSPSASEQLHTDQASRSVHVAVLSVKLLTRVSDC